MNNLRLLWSYMKGNRMLYVGAILSVALAALFQTLNPLIFRITLDSIIGDQPLDTYDWLVGLIEGSTDSLARSLWIVGAGILIITLLQGLFQFLKGRWSAIAAETIAKNMREKVYDHLQHLPYEYFIRAQTGDLIQRCTSDVDTIRQFLAVQLVEVGRAVFMLIFIASIMFSLNVKMALVSMAVIPFIFAFSYYFYREVKKTFKGADEAEGAMSTVLQENLTGVRIVRAFARQNYEVDKFDGKSKVYRDKVNRVIQLLAWYWSLSDLLSLIQITIVLVFGAYWAAVGDISLGTLVVFTTYIGMLLWPIRQMGRILTDWGKTLVSLERIQEILTEPKEQMAEGEFKPEIKGDIVFDHVSFTYQDGRQVLKDVSFTIKEGETVAILGPTGSGKSSLVHLLARLYDYTTGSITIGGHELKTIEKKWLRGHVGLILQEPFLFARSIRDNISLAKSECCEHEVVASARTAAVHDVILGFEQGYETLVGERGVSLSGGQKQRVAIARTLIRNCPVLIFDDSLSAVDTETDAAIRKSLKEQSKTATTLIISHRVNTLAEADKIIVLEDGQITQIGSHDDLINQPGLYRRVWEIQNSLEDELGVSLEDRKEASK